MGPMFINALPDARRIHFALIVLYNIYAMCILFWHFRRYVIIRHSYLTRGWLQFLERGGEQLKR